MTRAVLAVLCFGNSSHRHHVRTLIAIAIIFVASALAIPAAAQRHVIVMSDGGPVTTVKQLIHAATWGERWPFTVQKATLVCIPGSGGAGRFVVVDGTPFSATGAAAVLARREGISFDTGAGALDPVLFNIDEPAAERLWRQRAGEDGIRVNFGPVIAAFDELGCN